MSYEPFCIDATKPLSAESGIQINCQLRVCADVQADSVSGDLGTRFATVTERAWLGLKEIKTK